MTTADKRLYLEHGSKKLLHTVIDHIDDGDFRGIDMLCQEISNPIILQYFITLLCDELVYLTNETEAGDEF